MFDLENEEIQPGEGSGETAVPAGAGSDAAGGFEIDGEKYTPEQLKEALEAHRDRDAWEAAYKQRDQRHAGVRNAIEQGFGKKLTDMDAQDLRDLAAFGMINQKLRAEPAFAKAWEESLVEAYRKAGLSPGAAKTAAKEDVAAAKTGDAAKLPPEVEAKLGRVDAIENMIVEQGLAQFQGVLEKDVKGLLDQYAKDLTPFHPMVRTMILQGIAGYTDVELLEKYQSGELKREMVGLAKAGAKQVRDWTAQKGTDAGAALRAGKDGAPPAPTKGGTAERVVEPEYRPGRGLRNMTDRLLKELGTGKP